MAEKIFEVRQSSERYRGRLGTLKLRGREIPTPIFMPVGTRGTVKAMLPEEVAAIGYELILGNTFHLHLRPGDPLIAKLGGLHKFMRWDGAILTDSGGFQVYSLADIRKISEEGVKFRSPYDGQMISMRPEDSIAIQHRLGSDIIMAFDECLDYDAPANKVRPSMEMTLRWLERCRVEHQQRLDASGETHHLFGIVQGHFDAALRAESAQRTAAIDLPGYAIGGLSVGEPVEEMLAMLDAAIVHLPEDKPRYAMGIGLPMNLIDMVMQGVDMFDCVVPTRNARNGRVYTFEGVRSIKHEQYAEDAGPLEADCPCRACQHYSRAYLRHLFKSNEILSARLLTEHNLTFFWRLMARIREALAEDRLPEFRNEMAAIFE